jgi:branched-chain amino acid transport system substrate-binding protein
MQKIITEKMRRENLMFKKGLSILLSLIMITTLFSGCKRQGAAANEILIGAVFPFTGDAATYGQSSKNSLELLVADTNSKGGLLGKKVKIIYEDDANTPTQATSALQKLINNDRIVAVLGTTSSKACIAMGPVATSSKIPMITATATNPKVTTSGGEYVFRATFIDPFQGTVVAKFATDDLKAKNAAVLYDVGNDYSTGLADAFKKAFEGAGGKVLSYETYSTGDQDFSAQLTKIKGNKPDVLLLPDYYNVVCIKTRQLKIKNENTESLGIENIFLLFYLTSKVNGGILHTISNSKAMKRSSKRY